MKLSIPMQQRLTTYFLGVTLAMALAACGGGSDGGSGNPAPAAFATYQDRQLPGRLLVNSPLGNAQIFDLSTGRSTALPPSGVRSPGSHDGDEWSAAIGGAQLLLSNDTQTASDAGPGVRMARVNTSTLTLSAGVLRLQGDMNGRALLSPDARFILAFFDRGGGDPLLSVIDAATGADAKSAVQIDSSAFILDTPAAWLPDGRYVYLVQNRLYVAAPTTSGATLLTTLALPSNRAADGVGYVSGQSSIAVSPDGQRIAFTWGETRGVSFDKHLWVARLDGSELRRLTSAPDTSSPLDYRYTSPSWSPDGQWVLGVLDMHATGTAPLFPPSPYQDIPPPLTVSGTTGCGNSQVFVLPAGSERTALSWPTLDAQRGVKVRTPSGAPAWLTTCSEVAWLPS